MMIYGKSRNVVVIQNIDSGYVEQAILILKKNPGNKEFYASEEGIVKEAQRIIDQFNQNVLSPQKKAPKRNPLLGIIIISALVLFSGIMYFLF